MNDATPEYRFGPFLFQQARRVLLNAGEPVRLGSRAMDILAVLLEHAGEVVGKDKLMLRVWPNAVVEEGALRVHMTALRKALGEGQSGARFITNVPMRGYCLVAPVQRALARADIPAATPERIPHDLSALPAPLTRVIGRDDAIAAVHAAVAEKRLVTLVGPGGMGKTTVALAAAERLRSQHADGVRFVDLGALADGRLVASALATALGVPLRTEDPARDFVAWLVDRRMLIVLDNCEHLVAEAAAFVETLLAGARHVRVLATSREPLRARGEWVQRLASLKLPPSGAPLDYAQALAFPAFELFVERAAASLDGLAFGDGDVGTISSVCRRLDGMPLAIELVAAQVGFFGLAGLLSKLDDHLSLPTLGLRTALPRQQTLRATLEWSYRLLSPAEQRKGCCDACPCSANGSACRPPSRWRRMGTRAPPTL
jgi:DNA-binding winged helix-turn-helix (wHTH) protein